MYMLAELSNGEIIAIWGVVIMALVGVVPVILHFLSKEKKPRKAEENFMLSKLPATGHELFGRDEQLALLDKAWNEEHTNILSFVAWGGVGKTALVNEWLNRMGHDNYRGAEKVYGWSFYSQGTREDRQVSGDEFINKALLWFGDPDPKKGSPWDKGVRLAQLTRQQKTLLILDGLEPLQYPPGPMHGQLKDQGLQALLKELVSYNPGLCVISTRQEIKDIEKSVGSSVKRIELENLSIDAGVELLKRFDIKGSKAELKKAVEEFAGHALALNLLGSYLSTVHKGDIRKRDLVPHLTEDQEQGGHAKRVMQSYEIWLADKPELDILYLMGLFDRPAPGGAIDELRKEPTIPGLTDKLQSLSQAKWKYAVKHLRDLRLLGTSDENDPGKLDCHPLVREHFGEKLQKTNPDGWREAHSRLYEYYKALPEKLYNKELPDTLEEMEPLYAAVNHGCLAGRYQKTFEDVYWERICKGNEYYSTKKLGAFGADLAAVSCFFQEPFSKLAADLTDPAKAGILNFAGFRLRALGRLTEAIEPMKAGLEIRIKRKAWENAAIDAGNLSELYLALGEVANAIDYAQKCVDYANKSGNIFEKFSKRTTLADALHQSGKIAEAKELFEKAEQMQIKVQPEFQYLYSLWGFRYCDLLLSQGKYKEVQERVNQTIQIAEQYLGKGLGLWDIGFDKLSLGRAYMLEAVAEKSGDFSKARDWLIQAVDSLRKAGTQDHLPRGLLARAQLYHYMKQFGKARADLDEVLEIAEQGQMNLYLADYHLESARLCLAEGNKEKARQHYKEAKEKVNEMGYHRRDPELKELQAQLKK